MFIELVDVLRCPNPHEETWLVLATRRIDGRDVMDGLLGCPVCKAEFPITEGVARFDREKPRFTRAIPPDENESVRLAALLDLADARGYAILAGETGNHADSLRELTAAPVLLVDPPSGVQMGAGLSGLTTDASSLSLPLAVASARAIAFDDRATTELLNARLSVVSAGGRILAPVSLPLPDSVTELARDERQWLAERAPSARSSGVVSIARRK